MPETRRKILTVAGVLFLGLFASSDHANAARVHFEDSAFAAASSTFSSIPIGHAQFCRDHMDECRPNANFVDATPLTQDSWNQLLSVNSEVNTNVVPVTDAQLYNVNEFWTYPNGFGDCEDYVLEKRRELIALGWAASTLLITVVRQTSGEGHAVLMVRTDRGDLVLDNLASLVTLWNETPYLYLKRQSQTNAGQWVDLIDTRPIQIAQR